MIYLFFELTIPLIAIIVNIVLIMASVVSIVLRISTNFCGDNSLFSDIEMDIKKSLIRI